MGLNKKDKDKLNNIMIELIKIQQEFVMKNDSLLSADYDFIKREDFKYIKEWEVIQQRQYELGLEAINALKDNIATFWRYKKIEPSIIKFLEEKLITIRLHLLIFNKTIKIQEKRLSKYKNIK